MSKPNARSGLWWALGAAAVGGLAVAQRTRRFDLIHPYLRSPQWWFRTPTIGRYNLLIARALGDRPSQPVPGVTLDTRTVAAADGTPLTVFVYRPDAVPPVGAAMLYTHGGGMIVGSAAGYHETVSAMPGSSASWWSAPNTG